ncbi:MAG TPA: hypothetical protein VGD04_06955 [Methylophilus sp.]
MSGKELLAQAAPSMHSQHMFQQRHSHDFDEQATFLSGWHQD